MADISKIKVPGGTEYTLKARTLSTARTIDGVDFNGTAAITHYGTCSTAKGTAAKVVDIDGFKLVTGAVVWVRFTVTNTAAVANLTLNVNGTGAKHIKYRGANLGSVGYLAAGRTYPFVYDGTYWELAGDIDTTTNIGNHLRASCAVVKVGSTAIKSVDIIVAGTDGLYIPLNSGKAFDTKRPIFCTGTATDAGGTSTNNYVATTLAVANIQDMTMTPLEPIYIKGHLSDATFTPVSTTPLTQTEPTTADGYQYIFLGIAYSATSFWLSYDHPVYAYIDGAFQTAEQWLMKNYANVQSYITDITGTTSASGNMSLNINAWEYTLTSAYVTSDNGLIALPWSSSTGVWYVHVTDTNMNVKSNYGITVRAEYKRKAT